MKAIKCALSLLLSILLIFIFTSCYDSDVPEKTDTAELTSLEFCTMTDVDISLDPESNSAEGYIRFTKNGGGKLTGNEFALYSYDDDIASIEVLNTSSYLIKYRITAHSAGETCVFAANKDMSVTSSKIKVKVSGGAGSADEAASSERFPPETEILHVYTDETVPQISAEGSYVLNTKTKKIHHKDCTSVSQIYPENYGTTDDPSTLLANGYSWCQRCHK